LRGRERETAKNSQKFYKTEIGKQKERATKKEKKVVRNRKELKCNVERDNWWVLFHLFAIKEIFPTIFFLRFFDPSGSIVQLSVIFETDL